MGLAGFAVCVLLMLLCAVPSTYAGTPGHQCLGSDERFTGRSFSLSKAKRRARIKWRLRAGYVYGRDYNTWQCARGKEYTCRKRGRWHICTVRATPCKC
jgi:hypothetical protein